MLRWIENSVTTETLTVRHRPERKDHEQLIRKRLFLAVWTRGGFCAG
jgi:hypothetical protein